MIYINRTSCCIFLFAAMKKSTDHFSSYVYAVKPYKYSHINL